MWRIESIERKVEKDRELTLTELEGDTESKLSTEVDLEMLKYSFEMQHQELKNQLKLQKANLKVEMEKQTSEKLAHVQDPKLS